MTAPAVPPLTDQPVGKPLLLRGPLAETDLLPHSLDFQARVGRPVGPADTDATPCVVVLTRTADREIDELSVRLAALGIPLLRPDSDRCAGQSISYDLDAEVLITPGGAFSPRVGWRRYFQTSALPAATEPRLAAYARDQWLPWADTVLAGPSARVVNPAAAPDRVTQLVHARAAGLKTPATLVTTTPADAVRLIPGAGDLIVKTLGEHFVEPAPGRVTGIAPRRVSRNELAAEGGVELAPVLVQELIPCARELRIYAVAGELIAFAVRHRSPEARWTDLDRVRAAAVPVPRGLARPLHALRRRFALDVAAFDVLDAPGGPVFLEVNAACDWLWCEAAAGCAPVTTAVLTFLADAFRDAITTTTSRRNER
jgi:hypothetical protein